MEDFTRPWIEGSPVADKIEFIIGDALTEAPKLGIQFDMAFIDGDKRTYRECYEMVLSILRPGGFILADNTLWDGHVVDHAYDHDRQTQGIETFNDYIAADDRVEQVILPLRDGLTDPRHPWHDGQRHPCKDIPRPEHLHCLPQHLPQREG